MAAEATSMDSEAYINREIAYKMMGDHDQAIANFSKALEINPRLAAAYVNRGRAYRSKDQYDRAISDDRQIGS
jgi:tetratricopeptide (TPR) repeat protein